jgi:hypothetical protein
VALAASVASGLLSSCPAPVHDHFCITSNITRVLLWHLSLVLGNAGLTCQLCVLLPCYSTGALDVNPPQDASEPASAPEPRRPVAVPPAYTCKKAPGQLGAYSTNSSNSKQAVAKNSSGGSTAAGSSSRRWVLPAAKDVVPYPKPQPAFPATAVTVEPTAPLMPVPEEHPCA